MEDEPTSGRRSRRAKTKVNYAKEQEFSDLEDVFQDSPDEDERAPKRGRPRSSRKSTGGDGVVMSSTVELDENGIYLPPKKIFTEKGYDPDQLPIRERFPFLPEYELDGSPRIELIVGRRPVDEKESNDKKNDDGDDDDDEGKNDGNDSDDDDDDDDDSDSGGGRKRRGRSRRGSKKKKASPQKTKVKKNEGSGLVEYEYLVKYKNRSYLHLEWKTGADLESMNKSAKNMYRRYLRKLDAGQDDELEDPNFDPSFAEPQKVVAAAEQELTLELSDKELIEWEKEREKELAEESSDSESDEEKSPNEESSGNRDVEMKDSQEVSKEEKKDDEPETKEEEDDLDWKDGKIDFSQLTIERLRKIVDKEGSYYPVVEGSDNPYRDGYVTEPPKKPRASYIFFQCTMRSYFAQQNPGATQGQLMAILGEQWNSMSDLEQQPFLDLANEEAKQYDKEKFLLEKAQRPNEMWQPIRRCLMVLERLAKDGFASIFLEPVDLDEFPDYEELIDQPMDLSTIRTRLLNRKYQAPEQFARDMRKVWNNCKIYNSHGSAIWHVADYMAKQFERLYHAWVLEYRERYLRWAHPRARPWENTCRQCDGKCGSKDEDLLLCDHCDAMYNYTCLKVKKAPTGVWHCPDCKPKSTKTIRGVRMMSAIAEQAARKRAELGDTPKRTVKQTMYLVKWVGLGYEFCTWETKDDIGNPAIIAEYTRLNNASLDEPEIKEVEVQKVLDDAKHVDPSNAGGKHSMPTLRSQLYAQTRSFQFCKFGMSVPEKLGAECGAKTKTLSSPTDHPSEVLECLNQIVCRVSQQDAYDKLMEINKNLPPLLTGEYDVVVPITSKGLMMNVGEINGAVSFLGYRTFPDGSKGPSQKQNLIRNVGDKIIAVDGVSTVNKSFKEVIGLLRKSGKNNFALMRFLEGRYGVCNGELMSVGNMGRYTVEELREKFSGDRKSLLIHRGEDLDKDEIEDEDSVVQESASQDSEDDDSEASEGEFEPESDEEYNEMVDKDSPSKNKDEGSSPDKAKLTEANEENSGDEDDALRFRAETTQSLASRLLDIDIGYSSDEGGDEDRAYYLEGVDNTFTSIKEIPEDVFEATKSKSKIGIPGNDTKSLPVKKNDFSTLGDKSKLFSAVALTSHLPDPDDFDNFPNPSTKSIEQQKAKELEASNAMEAESPEKEVRRSAVKVEQISPSTNETIHVWANVEAAAATLQIPLNQIRQVLRGEYDEDLGDEIGGFRWRYAAVGATVTAGKTESKTKGSKKGQEAWLQFRDRLYDPSEPHFYKNGNRLRDYQVEGVNWLASTYYKKHGCILADEMGLGKTVQIVCYLEHLSRVEKIRRPHLVVVPLSTVEHWRREFEGWTNMVCCVYHDRQRVWRDVLREYEWYYEDRPHNSDFLKFDVLVTTYDTLIADFDVISQIPFRTAVVDEAHRLRNQKGKLLECMKEISAKGTLQYGYQSRVLMSGTPLQNDLNELWTLLNFIEPFKFPDLDEFLVDFGNMASKEQVEALQNKISPFMLRRVKEDVAKDIPAKEETVIDVELTSIQKQYYRAIFEHNLAFLNMGTTRQAAPKLMNIQMELRKVCNHPCLLEGVEHREQDRQFREFLEQGEFEGKTPEEQQRMINEHLYIQTSGKMVLMDKLLPKLRKEGHKILIFSQMVRMLDLISEYCEFRNFPYERLDGRVRGTDRQKSIDRFERDKDSFLFLLSTRAGGVGINLTAADTCIIFDSDWNPQNDVQAQARCHRIGQTKDVRIYRLITSRSFEQEMFDRASKKLGLEQAVLGTFDQQDDDNKPTSKEMEQLLKKGAYALLEDENDEITKDFCADDIDSILAKRTRTRVVEGAKTASWLNKQGMVVSKSKFTSDSKSADLDVEDPLFWQKVMPDFVTPTIMLQKLQDLSDEVFGTTRKKGRGRGRWKRKKADEKEESKEAESAPEQKEDGKEPKDLEAGPNEDETPDKSEEVASKDEVEKKESEDQKVETEKSGNEEKEDENEKESGEGKKDDDEEGEKEEKFQLTRTHIRKIAKFISDLKSMMEGVFDEADDDALPAEEKQTAEKLLLTISVKEKLFNEEQRALARSMLKRLEGNRRRRCRVSEVPMGSPSRKGAEKDDVLEIREELRIVGTKQKKKKRKKTGDEPEIGEDGYKIHSDDEADWSDVGEDIYQGTTKKQSISTKEANRRRQWAANDDAATAAGRAWPVLPRTMVASVLGTLLEEVIKYDEANGGIFSVPVPRDEFPEYYEQITTPMDYGTMKKKLENGEYRSAQAMQKDFVLVMQNCLKFNAKDSEIVQEARKQTLMRPNLLRDSAKKHDLFLAEDGNVFFILDDDKKNKDGNPKKRRRRKKGSENEETEEGKDTPQKRKKKKKTSEEGDDAVLEADNEEEGGKTQKKKKAKKPPRIQINVPDEEKGKGKKRGRKQKDSDKVEKESDSEFEDTDAPVPKKKKARKSSTNTKLERGRSKKKQAKSVETEENKSLDVEESSGLIFLDVESWKKKRESLDGTFKAARGNFTEEGPWRLPSTMKDSKFRDVALATLSKVSSLDRYSLFAEAVDENEVSDYYEVVKNPIHMEAIRTKVKNNAYGEGTEAASKFYEDFLLMFDNCALYNDDDGEVIEEAIRLFGLVPEAYAGACHSIAKKQKARGRG